jgi:hypothetical protein
MQNQSKQQRIFPDEHTAFQKNIVFSFYEKQAASSKQQAASSKQQAATKPNQTNQYIVMRLKIMFNGRQSGEMGNYLDFQTLIISGGIFLMCHDENDETMMNDET